MKCLTVNAFTDSFILHVLYILHSIILQEVTLILGEVKQHRHMMVLADVSN